MKNALDNLFGRSPIRPMQRHMVKVHSCVSLLSPFFSATVSGDWTQAENIQQQIHALEREADDLKRDIRLKLPGSLLLAVPRTDILDLLTTQDTLANLAQDIAGLMLGRQMRAPAVLVDGLAEFIGVSIQSSERALRAINELDELVEAGFRGKEAELVEGLIQELDRVEGISDSQQVQLRRQLLTLEAELPPVDVMFLYQVIDWVGELADSAQKIGHRLMLLIAR